MSEEEQAPEEDILNQLTPEELYELGQYTRGGLVNAGLPADSFTVHKFLHDIAISKDTTKTGFLESQEVGTPTLPVRSLKQLALFCDKIWKQPLFAEYFLAESEIITATSLSKDGFLVEKAVTTTRQLGDITKRGTKKKNKGWFKGKKDEATVTE